jgi:hypothetical protein
MQGAVRLVRRTAWLRCVSACWMPLDAATCARTPADESKPALISTADAYDITFQAPALTATTRRLSGVRAQVRQSGAEVLAPPPTETAGAMTLRCALETAASYG